MHSKYLIYIQMVASAEKSFPDHFLNCTLSKAPQGAKVQREKMEATLASNAGRVSSLLRGSNICDLNTQKLDLAE